MADLTGIAKLIDESRLDCVNMAKKLGFEDLMIHQIKSNFEFVSCLTNRLWKDIFSYFGINFEISEVNAPGIQRLAKILSGKQADCPSENRKREKPIEVINEISMRVTDWKPLARVLGFRESYVRTFESTTEESLTGDIFEQNAEKNKRLMNYAFKISDLKRLPAEHQSWKFWRNCLNKFENGREVIKEMERFYPELLAEVSTDLLHETTSSQMTYIGHPLQHEPFQVNKNSAEIPVNVGSSSIQIINLEQHSEWLETQERYMEVFNLFKNKVAFNFHDLEEYCPILNTLKKFIKDTGRNGFATKGYHLVDNLKMFDQRVILYDNSYENYFCFLGNFNVAINFTKCSKGPGHALHYSSQNIRIANALHKELQQKDIVQVNVVVQNNENVNFCSGCIENHLYIKEEVLADIEKFRIWFAKLQRSLARLTQRVSLSKKDLSQDLVMKIKKDMITYEALQNTDALPNFSPLGEDQMNEMPKIIFLTGVQFAVLLSNKKHIVLRGPYGCGKSIVLRKKLDRCIQSMDREDIVYYICHDQQSKFTYVMKLIRKAHPNKFIITCNSSDLPLAGQKPTLSLICNHILSFWRDKRVHIFIDEFCGSYINKTEVEELQKVLPKFSNSRIVLSMQSMEERVHKDASKNASDYGYQYNILESNTSFVVYNLDYSLRCSTEINDFVKATSAFMEKKEISFQEEESFYDDEMLLFVDKEYGQEKNFQKNKSCIRTRLSYNIPDKYGHSSRNGPVDMYIYDKFNLSVQGKLFRLSKPIIPPLIQLYISTLEYILLNASEDQKFVVCTYDEHLYSSVYCFFENDESYIWTNELEKFAEQNSEFNILLTDYASVRGYEFENFIFLLPMGAKYLKYRMIECFTRATTKLHVITDNVNTSNKLSSDNQLIKLWKSLPCVRYFDCKYDQSKDTLRIVQGKDVKYLYKDLSLVPVKSLNRFPWSEPKKVEEKDGIRSDDDLYETVCYLCENDDVNVILEFFKTMDMSIFEYRGSDNDNLLHISARMGGINIAKYLISECQFEVESCDDKQQTPLHCGADDGRTEVVQFLINNEANIHAKDDDGRTPLHFAADDGRMNIVMLLLNNEADIQSQDKDGRTPLHYGAIGGHVEVVKLLIENKADIHAVGNDGQTPLHLAAWYGHVGVFKLLIDNKANISVMDNYGWTPLDMATLRNKHDIVELIEELSK